MGYSICVIDDTIPASGEEASNLGIEDTVPLNASNLKLLLGRVEWRDGVIRNLIQTLLDQKGDNGISSKWNVYGVTNPSFYLNAINDGFFRSDAIIYDWEYPGAQNAETNAEGLLRTILAQTFCLVFIFSGADKREEIERILQAPEFQPYKERIRYLDKAANGANQSATLLEEIQKVYQGNFSFTFAGLLRRNSAQTIDQILSDVGTASLNDVKNLIVGEEHGGKKDFVDFLAERFRASIANKDVYSFLDDVPRSAEPVERSLAKSIWAYRLYFHQPPGDELVRRGDVVQVDGKFQLVISADCDLGGFWSKNLGVVNAVALHGLDQTNASLRAQLRLCLNPQKQLKVKVGGSLTARMEGIAEGPFVLPFVPTGQSFKSFMAMPKELISTPITTPAEWEKIEEKKRHPMLYSYWQGASRVCTISEPFLTPVIQHILATLGGYGVPDYPATLTKILQEILDAFSVTPAPAPPPKDEMQPAPAGPAPEQPATDGEIASPQNPIV